MKKPINSFKHAGRQQGSVMLIALIFLLILTLASLTSMRTSTMELRMAGNEEIRVTTVELTQSIIDETVGNSDNIVINGTVGYVNCTSNVSGCTANDVEINSNLIPDSKLANVEVVIESMEGTSIPRAISSSPQFFDAARFQVDATYDGRVTNEGRSGIVQGVLILVSKPQTN